MRAVADTNVLVDYLRGIEAAAIELDRYHPASISLVTWMEILVGARTKAEEEQLRAFLRRFEILPIDQRVADDAVHIRRERRLRLPDALIWATARVHERILVTRNTRDFPAKDPGIRIPYHLE